MHRSADKQLFIYIFNSNIMTLKTVHKIVLKNGFFFLLSKVHTHTLKLEQKTHLHVM